MTLNGALRLLGLCSANGVKTSTAMTYDRELADATIRKKIEASGRRETATRLRGTLSGIFRLAVMTLRAESDPTYAIKGALLPVKVTNRAAITDEKVFGQFLRDLDAYTGAKVIKDALLFHQGPRYPAHNLDCTNPLKELIRINLGK